MGANAPNDLRIKGDGCMLKLLVHQYSSTQRIVAQKNDDGSWLISKYWRKTADDPWIQGKGIELPVINGKQTSKRLGELLVADGEIEGFENVTNDEYRGSEKSEPNNQNTNSF